MQFKCYLVSRSCKLFETSHERDGVSNHQPHDCLLNRLFRRRSKETSKLRFTGLCAGNTPVAGEFPTRRASNAENVSIWWRHHEWHWSSYTVAKCQHGYAEQYCQCLSHQRQYKHDNAQAACKRFVVLCKLFLKVNRPFRINSGLILYERLEH